tara:strand:+ start:2837 stop:3772 length:936 start_codon:yes stop_codon:yes gene_type:complete
MKLLIAALAGLVMLGTSAAAETLRVGSTKGSANYQTAVTVTKYLQSKGIRAIPAPHNGQQQYVTKLNAGKLDMAQGSLGELTNAYWGRYNHEKTGRKDNLRLVSRLQCLYTGLIVPVESDIHSYHDLHNVNYPGGFKGRPGLKLLLGAFLRNAGLGWDDVNEVSVSGIPESWKLYKTGRTDVALGALGAGSMLPIDAARKSRWISFDDSPKAVKEFLGDEFIGYEVHRHEPKKAYPLLKEPANLMCVPYYLYTHVNASEDTIYEVAKAMAEATFEGGFMSSFSQKNVADPKNKIPFHKGAVKAYKELGLME